ncbi:MAG: AAA family ATPase [Candidatus Limnocylindria bacterium]
MSQEPLRLHAISEEAAPADSFDPGTTARAFGEEPLPDAEAKPRATELLRFEYRHGACTARWGAPLHVELDIDRFSEDRGELKAEVVVRYTAPGLERQVLAPRRVPLLGTRAPTDLAKDLRGRIQGVDWGELLELAFTQAIRAYRNGEPPVLLRDVPRRIDPQYELYPFCPRNLLGMGWGRPDEGKTLVAAAITATLATGRGDILGLAPRQQVRPLFLDWEQDEHVIAERIRMVAGEPIPDITYLACRSAIWDELDRIMRVVREHEIEYLIIDSVGMACGGIPPESSEAALRFGTALRRIGLGAFATAHVPKGPKADVSAPFGSIFWLAQLRLGWLLKREREHDGSGFTLGLFPKKSNNDRLPAPLGYDVTFAEGSVRFRRRDLAEVAELAGSLPVRQRIRALLRDGGLVLDDVIAGIDGDARQVRARVSEMKRRGELVQQSDGKLWLAAERPR